MARNPEHPKLLELFIVFAQVSVITIGGGYVMFPLLKREVVDSKGWISNGELVDCYALGQSVPGIIAMNTATLIGYRKRGLPGAITAAAGMAAPSLVVIILISAFLTQYFDNVWVKKAFAGVRASVVAMIGMAVWQVGRKSVSTVLRGILAAGSFLAIVALNTSPVLLIVAGGLLGLLLFRKETPA
jgi:chromate transporter